MNKSAAVEGSESGSISFSSFMHEALYHPQRGYYAAGRSKIGKHGDFFTNVSVGNIYGQILALFFEELWYRLECPDPFLIVEQGAHDGRLACDILEAIQKKEASSDADSISFFKSLRYYIVEPFSLAQQKQEALLKNFPQVTWVTENKNLPYFDGIHFSNELLDAFPVDLLHWNGHTWQEQRVKRLSEDSFSWIIEPIRTPELSLVAAGLPTTLPADFLWEVRLGIKPWLSEIASRMNRGMLLVADYGYMAADRFAPYRAKGSIACYEQHRRYDNPLENVGKRDISAHVDFTDLVEAGLQTAWNPLGSTDQYHFLIGAAEEWLRSLESTTLNSSTQETLRRFRTLFHPETMGRSFHFLGLGKNISPSPPLNGFRYARPTLVAS